MFQHFIITPFSFRRPNYVKGKFPDPLKPSILKERFRIFEIITLASLKAQENQDFTLIIIVDPLLPEFYRKKFLEVTSGLKKVIIHDFTRIVNQNTHKWLQPYISDETKYLIQTLTGADDAFFKGFTAYIQNYYNELFLTGNLPPIHFTSALNVIQWDFIHTKIAPYGYFKPWTRKETITIGSGLTYCFKYPEVELSVLANSHIWVGLMFIDEAEKLKLGTDLKKSVTYFADKIRRMIEVSFPDQDSTLLRETHFHAIETNTPQVLVLNFFSNVRFKRIFEHPELRIKITGETDFSEIIINFDSAQSQIKQYRQNLLTLLYLIWRQLFPDINKQNSEIKSLPDKIRYKIGRIKSILDGYKNMV